MVQSRLLCLLLVAVVALSSASLSLGQNVPASGSARLLVQKSLDHHTLFPQNFALDSPINVTLTVRNAGDVAATDIKLEDSWLAGFELSGPVGPWTWEELAPGASVNVSYFVTPTQQGPFESSPARVTYNRGEGGQQVSNGASRAMQLTCLSRLSTAQAPSPFRSVAYFVSAWTSVAWCSVPLDRLFFFRHESERDFLRRVREVDFDAHVGMGSLRRTVGPVRPRALRTLL